MNNLFDYFTENKDAEYRYVGTVWGISDDPWIMTGEEICTAMRIMWGNDAKENALLSNGYLVYSDKVVAYGHLYEEDLFVKVEK